MVTNDNKKEYLINNEKLMSEWNWDKNKKLGLDPAKITCGSGIKAWWVDMLGHEWDAVVGNRTKGSNCPYCSNYKVLQGFNDLSTTNPGLASEWNYEKNGDLLPTMVTAGSGKKVWWMCERGHEWEAFISNRSKGRGCPYCAGQYVVYGETDLSTTHPDIATEWHPTKNGNLTPMDVKPHSNQKAWWVCKKGHEWMATIGSRTSGCKCPYCQGEKKSSFPEQAILFYCSKITTALNRNTDFGVEIDIYLPEYNIGIEYNGDYWHRTRTEHDKQKNILLFNCRIRLITIIESDKDVVVGDVIYYKYRQSLNWCIQELLKLLRLQFDDIDVDVNKDKQDIYNQYIFLQKENSLKTLYPSVATEWHPTKNGELMPDMVTSKSNKVVWWLCSTCGYEWQSTIANRAIGHGCPSCTGRRKKRVYCLELQQTFESITGAGKHTGVSASNISAHIRGLREYAGRHPITKEPLHWHELKN